MKIKLFGFLFVCVLEMAVDMRAFGQCCWCDADDGCALGADNIGTLDVPECQSANCNNYDCSYCDENPGNPPDDGGSTGICPGYGDCGGVPSNYLHPNPGNCRCKSFNNVNCDGQSVSGWHICSATPSGVQYYDVFSPSGGYHFEGDKCYSNERACSKFDVNVTGATGDWTCKKEYQTGNAQWIDEGNNYTYWKVDACKCKQDNLNVSSAGCVVGHIDHELLTQIISNATTKIPYKQTVRYCGQCAPGKIPQKTETNSAGVTFAPNSNSGWGSYSCKNVSKPKYSTGCNINFDQEYSAVVDACTKSCDSHLETTSDGATSADDCKPDSTEYTDGIGKFTLGPDSCN